MAAEEHVAAEASVVDRSFVLLTCPHQVGPRCVNISQTDSMRRVHPPGFWTRWVFYFQKKRLKSCVPIVTTRIHVLSHSFTTYQNH